MSSLFHSHQEPLSPSSPPELGYKERKGQATTSKAPASPLSPPHMSVATKSYVSSYENNRHVDEMAQRSPRSPSSGHSNMTPRVDANHHNTPNNLKRPFQDDEGERQENKRQRKDGSANNSVVDTQISSTNHERQDSAMIDSTEKSDSNEREHTESTSAAIKRRVNEDDEGPVFLLCKSSHSRIRPDPNQHLMGIYGLSSLLQTVARTHPVTGEKINKLRKSYEGQVKSFALPGRIKPYKEPRDEDQAGKLRNLATLPEPEWEKQVDGVTIEVADALRSKLQHSLQLNSGTMSKSINAEWEDVLGHEKPKSFITNTPSTVPMQPRGINGIKPQYTAGSVIDKMKTRGKKRSYDDSSFYGYAEGYSDEDHSDRDFERRKKRRE